MPPHMEASLWTLERASPSAEATAAAESTLENDSFEARVVFIVALGWSQVPALTDR